MNLFSKIIFGILAILILGIGYFIGAFILSLIFVLILLISLFYVVTIIFNNVINITQHKYIKDIIKIIFSLIVTFIVFIIIWSLFKTYLLNLNLYLLITIIWALSNIIFGVSWVILKQRELYLNNYDPKTKIYTLQEGKNINNNKLYYVKLLDVFFIIIFSSLFTYLVCNLYVFV
jgi:hypothetical protein